MHTPLKNDKYCFCFSKAFLEVSSRPRYGDGSLARADQGHRVSLRVRCLLLLRLPQVDLLDELRHCRVARRSRCHSGSNLEKFNFDFFSDF